MYQKCKEGKWDLVLSIILKNPCVGVMLMTMANLTTTIIHQAIASRGDNSLRAKVIFTILEQTPDAGMTKMIFQLLKHLQNRTYKNFLFPFNLSASMENGYGSLPLHAMAQRNVKMDSKTKERLILALIEANKAALTTEGGAGKRTPLHILLTGMFIYMFEFFADHAYGVKWFSFECLI